VQLLFVYITECEFYIYKGNDHTKGYSYDETYEEYVRNYTKNDRASNHFEENHVYQSLFNHVATYLIHLFPYFYALIRLHSFFKHFPDSRLIVRYFIVIKSILRAFAKGYIFNGTENKIKYFSKIYIPYEYEAFLNVEYPLHILFHTLC